MDQNDATPSSNGNIDTIENTLLKIEKFVHGIGQCQVEAAPLYQYVIKSFFANGSTPTEIYTELKEGVKGVDSVTKERVRSLVYLIRDELISPDETFRYTKGIKIKKSLVRDINDIADKNVGIVIKKRQLINSPRLIAVAAMLRMRIIREDTVIPWITKYPILLSTQIDKRVFNAHFLSTIHFIQDEVIPTTRERIMQHVEADEAVQEWGFDKRIVDLILTYDDIFTTQPCEDGSCTYQAKFEYLNIAQQLARIIYDLKEVTPTEIIEEYRRRGGKGKCTSIAMVRKNHKWCVPVGKSKWIYSPDGEEMRNPNEVIREFCYMRKHFTMDDLFEYLESKGYHTMHRQSMRCYVMKYCRRRNDDSNVFCLTELISKEEDSQWHAKHLTAGRSIKKPWIKQMRRKVRQVLKDAPDNMMAQKLVRSECLGIFEKAGIAPNNFYKHVNEVEGVEAVTIEDEIFLKLVKF